MSVDTATEAITAHPIAKLRLTKTRKFTIGSSVYNSHTTNVSSDRPDANAVNTIRGDSNQSLCCPRSSVNSRAPSPKAIIPNPK